MRRLFKQRVAVKNNIGNIAQAFRTISPKKIWIGYRLNTRIFIRNQRFVVTIITGIQPRTNGQSSIHVRVIRKQHYKVIRKQVRILIVHEPIEKPVLTNRLRAETKW